MKITKTICRVKNLIKSFLFFVCAYFIFVSSIFCQETNKVNQSKPQKPNVLFIICDDLNDYVGAFGGHPQAKTPNMDKLAASGVRFLNAHANVPFCSPSRNSMITGVYPHVSKDYKWTNINKHPVLKNNKSIVQLFKENGYFTLGTGKINHWKIEEDWNEWGMDRKHNYGPFYFDGNERQPLPTVPSPFRDIGKTDGSYGRLSDAGFSSGKKGKKGLVYGDDHKPLRYVSDEDRDLLQDELHAQWAVHKLKELERQENPQPFFMGVGFIRPHTPLHAPDKYFDMFPIDELKLEPWKKGDKDDTYWSENFNEENQKGSKFYRDLLASYGGDREKAMKHFLQAYLACVAFVDDQIGKVLDGLNNSVFKDNTIIVFTSDHGWQMGEKDYLFKNSPWEESTKIPLILKVPKLPTGHQVTQPVSLIDVYPTLVDLCDLKGNNKKNENGGNLGGHSLRPLINKKPKNWKGPNGALTVLGNFGTNTPSEKQNYSYRTENWRYIKYNNGKEELYNHIDDPYEWNNLAYVKDYTVLKRQLEKEIYQIID